MENAQTNDTQTNNSMNDNTTDNPINDTQVVAADTSTATDAAATDAASTDAAATDAAATDAAATAPSETEAQAAGDDANDAMTGAPSTEASALTEAPATEAPLAERSGENVVNGSSNESAPDMSTHAATDSSATPSSEASASETPSSEASASETPSSEASTSETSPGETPASEPARPSRQPSMAQVMESDEFSSYMSGVDALTRGALLKGVVVRVDENTGEALVDIGTKSEGIIARNEMGDEPVSVGDEVEVVVVKPEDDEGHPVVSKRRADYEKTWRVIQQAKDKNTSLEGIVREQVKGGLIVDLGVPAFVPASHVDARNRGDLSRFVGRTIPVRVIEIDRKKNKVIASHRQAASEDREKREAEAWGALKKDEIVEGVVRRITDFGAFIDLGGIDGLLHVREMAWSRVEHPETVVKKGQKLQVLILEIDEERKRVALGLKQLQSDPWKKAAKDYKPGQMLTGKVVRLAPSCAFVELADGVEGIIPVSEISQQRINAPEDVLSVGQEVEARIKQIQTGQRRITLSLKAAVEERETRETRTQVRQVNERATADDSVRLGDLFGQQLRAARERGKERNELRSEARARAMQAAEAEIEEDDVELEDEYEDTGVDEVEDTGVDEVQDGTDEGSEVEADTQADAQ